MFADAAELPIRRDTEKQKFGHWDKEKLFTKKMSQLNFFRLDKIHFWELDQLGSVLKMPPNDFFQLNWFHSGRKVSQHFRT
jgi:hypothetical protein